MRGSHLPLPARWAITSFFGVVTRLVGAVSFCILALLVPGIANAEGGTSIAGATAVSYGTHEFGDTANGGAGQPGCDASSGNSMRSWWALQVAAGDQVTVDWGTQSTDMYLNIFPTGTTDYNFPSTSTVVTQQVNSNYKNEATYTSGTAGTLPLEFKTDSGCGDAPAPYDFVAAVSHGVVLTLPTGQTTIPQSGSILTTVNEPDGTPIGDQNVLVTLQVKSNDNQWVALGSARPNAGSASIAYTFPSSLAGQTVDLRASSSGAGFQDADSSEWHVAVQSPPPAAVIGPATTTVPTASCPAAQTTDARALDRVHTFAKSIKRWKARLKRAHSASRKRAAQRKLTASRLNYRKAVRMRASTVTARKQQCGK